MEERRHPVVLLSLFDGTGFARLAVEDAMRTCPGAVLAGAAFVEIDGHLRNAVNQLWQQRAQRSPGTLPYTPLAADVWDLMRPLHQGQNNLDVPTPGDAPRNWQAGNPRIARFASQLPSCATVLIIAGSPCQQLTYGGRNQGGQGLCGPDSVHFFVVPTVAWAIQELRPDVHAHIVLENAASMQPRQKQAILQALGFLEERRHLRTMNSGNWTAFPRNRHYFSTLGDDAQPSLPERRPQPWETGWAPRADSAMEPMMRSRDANAVRASTRQYHPRSLVYRRTPIEPDGFDWHGWPAEVILRHILTLMPEELRPLYTSLVAGRYGKRRDGTYHEHAERDLVPVMRWIDEHGPALGFRIPTPHERARSTGRLEYLLGLHLSPVQLYDAVGNHFDPDALSRRLIPLLRQHLEGRGERPHRYLPPTDLAAIYQELATEVGRQYEVQGSPFPGDLAAALCATLGHERRGPPTPPAHGGDMGDTQIAAEDGRRGR